MKNKIRELSKQLHNLSIDLNESIYNDEINEDNIKEIEVKINELIYYVNHINE